MTKGCSRGVAAAVSLIALLPVASGAALAELLEKCPVESSNQKDIAAALSAAPGCAQAYDILNACRSNASGDVALADIVVQMCERTFMSTIEPAQTRSYKAGRDACARKFAHQDGTRSASFQATCEAGVAVVFANRADIAAKRAKRTAPAPYGNLTPLRP